MNWTAILQRVCEDPVMALEHWLDEHFTKVERLVLSLIVDGCPHHNESTPGAAILHDLSDTSAILRRDHETEEYPASKLRQVALRIALFSKILDATNTDPQDVMRIKMLRRDFGALLLINPHWTERDPVPQCWPTRHATRPELPEGRIIQVIATANLAEG